MNSLFRMNRSTAAAVVLALALSGGQPAGGQDDLDLLEQQAFRAAADRVAPSVVRIETIGGLERAGGVLLGTGPTTGLVVGADGHIISSAFNFLNRPTSILVRLPDGRRRPARRVATDHNRMLVLLKIDVDEPLVVPEFVPAEQVQVGQWAIAVGRTFEPGEVNLAVGLLSAVNRIWGKALQTDAAVSPNNYGGPLVDVRGRVFGVLVPLSPEEADEIAGIQWYDSGIGFAIGADDVRQVVAKLKRGKDLYPGLTGISFGQASLYTADPVIDAVRINSPAKQAGLRKGDRIVEIDGRKTARAADVKEGLGRHYAGDTVPIVVLRDQKRVPAEVELVARLLPYEHPFLGILPMRDAPAADEKAQPGVVVRYVYADSPAARAGIAPGDEVFRLNEEPVGDARGLRLQISRYRPDEQVKLAIRRAGATLNLPVKLGRLPEDVPADTLPPAREITPQDQQQTPQTGVFGLKIPEFENDAWAYVPEGYNRAVPHGVVIWLHVPGRFDPHEAVARWKPHCDRHDMILLAPMSAGPDAWQVRELTLIRKLLGEIGSTYSVDPTRVVVGGQAAGGRLAYQLGFRNRDLVRAVVASDAPLIGRPPENEPERRLAFYLAKPAKSRLADRIDQTAGLLRRMSYPVTVTTLGEEVRRLDTVELSELARWIDTLDRI